MSHRPRGRVGLFVGASLLGVALLLVSLPTPAQSLGLTHRAARLLGQSSFPVMGVVTAEDALLRVRDQPGTEGAIIARLEPGERVVVLGRSDDGQWLRIQLSGAGSQAWVAAEFVAFERRNVEAQAGATVDAENAEDAGNGQGPASATEVSATEASATPSDRLVLLPTPTPTQVAAAVEDRLPLSGNSDTGATSVTSPVSAVGAALAAASTAANHVATHEAATDEAVTDETVTDETAGGEAESTESNPAGETQASSAPTATPAPTPSVPTAVTLPANMNVRSGPGTNYSILTSVPSGTSLTILALSPGGDWYQVGLEGRDEPGYVYAPLTSVLGPTDTLRRLEPDEVPPEPTPAPAAAQAPVVTVNTAATVGSSASFPSSPGFFGYGIQAHMLGGEYGRALDAVSDLGFNWVKQQVEWRIFQPQPGAAGFGELHGIVSQAQARGINVLFSVVNAPHWAREPGFNGDVGGPPADVQTYAAYVGAMAGQFCGSALKAIEVWNEQNLHYEWGNLPLDPAHYMQLLRAAYISIKSACPEMLVISGALTPAGSNPPFAVDDFTYLEGMYQNGLAANSDGIGAHPSGYNVPATVTWENACAAIQQSGNSFNGACDTPHHSWSFRSTMEGYRNIMVVYGDANKRIWPTEFGWAAGGAFDGRYAYANDNSLDEQATWTVEAYQLMKQWGWVGPAFLWNLNFRVVADGTEKAQWGIVRNDWTPLPVYEALRAMPK